MKVLSCQDMGVDCDFVAKDDSVEGVIAKISDHAKEAHADKIKEMAETMTEDQMMEAMKSKVHEE